MIPLLVKINPNQNPDEVISQIIKDYKIKSTNLVKIYPEKNEITLGQIRQLQTKLILKNIDLIGYFFYFFDRSSLEVQNSLLKILEEKTNNNLFCFFVFNLEKIISTIKSRCKILDRTDKKDNFLISNDVVELIDLIKKSEKPTFIFDKKIKDLDKEKFLDFSSKMINYFRKELIEKSSQQSAKILKEILKLKELIENNNLNPQLAFDNLLIFIWKELK